MRIPTHYIDNSGWRTSTIRKDGTSNAGTETTVIDWVNTPAGNTPFYASNTTRFGSSNYAAHFSIGGQIIPGSCTLDDLALVNNLPRVVLGNIPLMGASDRLYDFNSAESSNSSRDWDIVGGSSNYAIGEVIASYTGNLDIMDSQYNFNVAVSNLTPVWDYNKRAYCNITVPLGDVIGRNPYILQTSPVEYNQYCDISYTPNQEYSSFRVNVDIPLPITANSADPNVGVNITTYIGFEYKQESTSLEPPYEDTISHTIPYSSIRNIHISNTSSNVTKAEVVSGPTNRNVVIEVETEQPNQEYWVYLSYERYVSSGYRVFDIRLNGKTPRNRRAIKFNGKQYNA